MRFAFDENMNYQIIPLLHMSEPDHQFETISDRFGKGAPDEEWINQYSQDSEKPVIVSGDGRILRDRAQRQVLKESSRHFVYLAHAWRNQSWEDLKWKYVKVWPELVRLVGRQKQPTLFELMVNPKAKVVGSN